MCTELLAKMAGQALGPAVPEQFRAQFAWNWLKQMLGGREVGKGPGRSGSRASENGWAGARASSYQAGLRTVPTELLGAEWLNAGLAAEWLNGGLGAEWLNGGLGAEWLNAGVEAEWLNAGLGAELLNGGLGAELLNAGLGAEWLNPASGLNG